MARQLGDMPKSYRNILSSGDKRGQSGSRKGAYPGTATPKHLDFSSKPSNLGGVKRIKARRAMEKNK